MTDRSAKSPDARLAIWHRQFLPDIRAAAGRVFASRKHGSAARAMVQRRRRIVLLGLFGCDNHGNDGSLEAMLGFLRRNYPQATLTTICVDPEKIERNYGVPGIQINWPGFRAPIWEFLDRKTGKILRRILNVFRTLNEIRRFDAVIVPGTGILSDYRADPFGAPYWVFRWCTAAKLCGVGLYLVNIGAGPIERKLSRWMLKQAAKSATYRSFRDRFSRDFVTGLGLDTSADHVYPDIVFTLPYLPTSPDIRETGRLATVGVGVMSYNGWQGHAQTDRAIYNAYLSQLSHFVSWLLERGHPVRLLVGEITDEVVAGELTALIRANHALKTSDLRLTSDPIGSLHDLMQQIDRTDIVVASRFHNIVCALKLGRPTISISYTKKHDELMDQVGLNGFYQRIEQLDAERLTVQFLELSDNRANYEARIAERVATFQEHFRRQDEVLQRLIS